MSKQSTADDESDGSKTQVAAPPLDLVHALVTDPGMVRDHNEDYAGFFVPGSAQQKAQKGTIYLVADGMGGHQAGEVASQGAAETVIREYYRDTGHDVGTCLVRAFRAANEQVHRDAQGDTERAGMGSTLVAAVILGRKVHIASVGDSRAYLVNARGIRQITEDHSWVAEQIRANMLTPEQARSHPQRNMVTRALGPRPTVEVDLFEGEMAEGDRLVLCSDGVTTHLQDADLASIVLGHPPDEAARQVVALANERGGRDNISVLIVAGQKAVVPLVGGMPAAVPPTGGTPVGGPAPDRGRRAPVIPILALALVAVLAAGGLLGGRLLLGGQEPTPTVAPAVAVSTQPAATGSPAVATLVSATHTATGVPAAPPTVTVTGTLATPLPTSTLIPTGSLAISPTMAQPSPLPATPAGPQASATVLPATPSPESTPIGAAILSSPPAGDRLGGQVTFEWRWDHEPLAPTLFFDLRIWSAAEEQAGQEPRGVIAPQKETRATVILEGVQAIEEHKNDPAQTFFWAVVVVRKTCPDCQPTIVGEWSEERSFYY